MADRSVHPDGFDDSALAEVALGVLDPAEVPGLDHHLAACPACRAQLVELTATADRLVALAPEVAPPAGFAERTVASVTGRSTFVAPDPASTTRFRHRRIEPLRPRHRLRFAVAGALAAAVVVAGAVVGVQRAGRDPTDRPGAEAATPSTGAPGASTLSTAALVTPTGRTVGLVRWERDDSTTMTVALHGLEPGLRYRCDLVLADGARREVGSWTVGSSSDRWTVSVPEQPADRVELRRDDGSPVATAVLG